MENWKRAAIADRWERRLCCAEGETSGGGVVGSVGLAVLASEYPERFVQIREELPSYVRQGTRFLDLAIKIGGKIEEFADKRAARAFEEFGKY